MDLTSCLIAYDAVMDKAREEGRENATADKMHAMRAAIEAYEEDRKQQANVAPPFAAPAVQRDAGWIDVSKVVGVLRKNRKPKQGSAHESVVVTFGPMGINAADKFLREFSEMVWRDRTSSLSQKCDQSLPAGSAKGGITNQPENGNG